MTEQPEDWDAIHDAMAADKGDDWKGNAMLAAFPASGEPLFEPVEKVLRLAGEEIREAMHDRDRFQRERDWWQEEVQRLRQKIEDMQDDFRYELREAVDRYGD